MALLTENEHAELWWINKQKQISMTQPMKKEDIQQQINMEKIEYYMVHVVGKQSPIKLHSNQLSAELEAERLAKSERKEVMVFKAITKFDLVNVIRTDLTK